MCGRVVQTFRIEDLEKRYHARPEAVLHLEPHYNFPPKTEIELPIIITENNQRVIKPAIWGLLPAFVGDPDMRLKYETFNAKTETLTQSKIYSASVRMNQFCLVPVDGYYEWYSKTKPSQPFFIHFKNQKMMSLAGLWARWESHDKKQTLYSFSIMTMPSEGPLKRVHHRMPVTLDPLAELKLIDPHISPEEKIRKWLKPVDISKLEMYPVERALVSFGKEDPHCIDPLNMDLDEFFAREATVRVDDTTKPARMSKKSRAPKADASNTKSTKAQMSFFDQEDPRSH